MNWKQVEAPGSNGEVHVGRYTVLDESGIRHNTIEKGGQTQAWDHWVTEHRMIVEHPTFGQRTMRAENFDDPGRTAARLLRILVEDDHEEQGDG